MSNLVPELVLLELYFRTVAPINNLPHYHGAHWSALFRNAIKPHLPPDVIFSEAGIWIQTIETGVLSYQPDDIIHLGLAFPVESAPAVSAMLNDFTTIQCGEGHFQPGKTVVLEGAFCRISAEMWDPKNSQCLSEKLLRDEIETLSGLGNFNICFHTPLRLPRPEGHKAEGHRFCDEDFFLSGDPGESTAPMTHLIARIRLPGGMQPVSHGAGLKVSGGALTWLDISYGEGVMKTIGGVVGRLIISGKSGPEPAERLVLGQYTGAGKNAVFGFGFYHIPELDEVRKIRPLTRGKNLLQRAMSIPALKSSLDRLPNSSPGPDMLSVGDIKKAGEGLLKKISNNVADGSYKQGGLMKYRLPKDDGTFRDILVQNVTDRLVHKAAADCLLPVVDGLLSHSSYAYRRGLNRKGAASALREEMKKENAAGIKADIRAFFDSVNIEILGLILEGLFPFEPLVKRVLSYLEDMQQEGVKGLPQGSPLSPLLSNLYLDRFDRDMEKEGFKLIRYGDDFAAFYRGGMSFEEVIAKVKSSLSKLGLHLKTEKTTEIKQGMPVKFLGYLVTSDDISEAPKDRADEDQDWMPVFKEEWLTGTPVYLTSICRGAHSNGPSLVVQTADGGREEVAWNRISRMVVVGRSSFSGGVVYRAVKEAIPVTFIDIMGRSRGHLYPEYFEMPEIIALQEQCSKDNEFRLSFSKEIISAKVHNSLVLLRRNSIDPKELRDMEHMLKNAEDLDALRGYEGAAAKIYFSEFSKLVAPFEFRGRVYHPPDGPINVMLSLGYTLLYNRLAAVLKDKGFNPRLGFFHKGRGTHSALASDLLEELRHIAERIVLSLIHRGEMKVGDFSSSQKNETNVCRLAGEGFRKYIHRFEVTMHTKSSYHGGEKLSCNVYLDEMADKLKRALKLNIPYRALRIE